MNKLTLSIAVTLALVTFSVLSSSRVRAQGDFSSELPRIAPTEPADALKTFRLADGFEIQLVASEPLISTPVAIEWDADGFLYVCEMRGYSEDRDDAISRVKRLEDTDDDGVFDKSTVYADGLLWPTAIFPFNGGLFVGDAPDLYYFQDLDGDGRADSKQVVLTGFGTSNVQGLMNSFRWGLDNRIHIACSSAGGMVRRPDADEKTAVNVRGRDIAFDPRTYEFELTSGAAQHGMCFDDWGRKFVSSNSNHLQQVMYEDRYIARNPLLRAPSSRISIASDGPQAEVYRSSPVEPWRIVRTRLRVGGLVPGPVEGGGRAAGYFTGATGVTIYRGDAWPEQWKGLAIIGDVGSNLIHRKRLEPSGLAMTGRRIDAKSEFVTSTDIWFRPAQFANAPDGTLHVIDVCREVIEHPKSLPPDIKKHLDLTSGRDRGRIYRIVPTGFQHRKTPKLARASTEQLVKLLEHPNAWHRETAARLLFERQPEDAPPSLRRLAAGSQSPRGRLHALYALVGQGELDEAVSLRALRDEHPHVRRHAVRLAEQIPPSDALRRKLGGMAGDPSNHVRYQLAFTVGSIPEMDHVPVLAKLIRQDVDSIWMQTAVQSSLSDGAGRLFANLIGSPEFRSAQASALLVKLAAQISEQNRAEETRRALDAIKQLTPSEAGFVLPIVGQLLKSRGRAGSVLAKLSDAGELEAVDRVLGAAVSASKVKAVDDSLSASERIAAIGDLAYAPLDDVAAPLESLIDNRQPVEVQRAAIRTLGSFNSALVTRPLLKMWSGLSPSLRETASEVLFARPDRLNALFDAVDAGDVPASELSRPRLQAASKSRDKLIRSRATAFLSDTGSRGREEVVGAYQVALTMAGEVDRGKRLFKKHCSTCHKVEGVGHEIGPNLATIKTRGAETILVNVLDPNREVNPQYLNYVVLTEDGRTLSGMIAAESATSVTLRRAEAATDTVLRTEIDRLQSTGLSIMPEGMEETIDPQAMADLIAYLMHVP